MIRVDSVSKRFRHYSEKNASIKQALLSRKRGTHTDFWALNDVSFDIYQGETFGIVGHNGSGKSTMLKCLTGILQPNKGTVTVNGSVSALLELGAGFHPELSGRENVFLNAAILGVPRRAIEDRFDEIVAFSGLEEFIDSPVKNYSSGMFVRLGFAVAVNVDPEILIIDEVLAVGDADFQAKCSDRISDFRDRGKTIVLVTHSMGDVLKLCNRAAWLDGGRLKMLGAPEEITESYLAASLAHRTAELVDGQRWGSHEVTIEDARLVGTDGTPIDRPASGHPLSIEIDLAAHSQINSPEIELTFFNQHSVIVSETSSKIAGLEIGSVVGQTTVSYTVNDLVLNAGTFEVTIAVRDQTGHRDFDVRSRYLKFDVAAPAKPDGGVVTLGGVWALR